MSMADEVIRIPSLNWDESSSEGSKESNETKSEEINIRSECEVDLGEGDIDYSDYPKPEKIEAYQNFVGRYGRTPEEQALYNHVLVRSDHFEAPFIPDCEGFCEFWPADYHTIHTPPYNKFAGDCKQAIDDYNKTKGTQYIFKYVIKITHNVLYEFNITFALTDPKHQPYVGRLKVETFPDPDFPTTEPLKITRGEYRLPTWKDVNGNVFKCRVNEELREKLPELEEKWKQMLHPATAGEEMEASTTLK